MNPSTSTADEILSLERKYWQAMKENDVATAVSLTRFPCVVTSPRGAMHVTESEYRQMMKSSRTDYLQGMEIADPKVEVIGDSTAIISYSVKLDGMKLIDSSTWVRTDGKWLCAFHTETPES